MGVWRKFLHFISRSKQPLTSRSNNNTVYPVLPSNNNLQHISDREEADDVDDDPSLHPSFSPLFIERSRSEMKSKYDCLRVNNCY